MSNLDKQATILADATETAAPGSAPRAGAPVDDKGKGKGKDKAPRPDDAMDEDEDDDDDDDDDEGEDEDEAEEDEDFEDEDEFQEINAEAILPQGRRTRGVKVDYTSPEALKKAGLDNGEPVEGDEEDDGLETA